MLADNFHDEYFQGMRRSWRMDDRVFVFLRDNKTLGLLYEVYGVRKPESKCNFTLCHAHFQHERTMILRKMGQFSNGSFK